MWDGSWPPLAVAVSAAAAAAVPAAAELIHSSLDEQWR